MKLRLVLAALACSTAAYPLIQASLIDTGVECISRMKQLGTGIQIYLQDYDDMFPPNAR